MTEEQIKKKIAYNDRLQRETLEQILIKPRKEERISERINHQVNRGQAASKQAYIIEAIKTRLEADEALEVGSVSGTTPST